MAGRASKQTYLGRVIYPAKYNAGKKPWLSFILYVDNLALDPNKNKISGKITCSYSIVNENDPVARILCRIYNKDNPGKGLAGTQFKSVDVLVEGNEKLTQVTDKDGNIVPYAWYKNLDFCTVQVVDKEVMKLYRAEFGNGTGRQDSQQESFEDNPYESPAPQVSPRQVQTEQPTTAPSPKAKVRQQWQKGAVVVFEGKEYSFLGGDESLMENWAPVEQVVTKEPEVPFAQSVQNSGTKNSLKTLLEEDGVLEESPLFQATKGVAV